jgi:hypothetical protein
MKQLNRTAVMGIGLAAALLAGCTSEKRKEAALAHLGDETPPDFLAGPASSTLGGFDGFSADVVSTSAAAIETRTWTGQVLERQGRLIFQPETTARIKKGKIVRGGMIFIWDTAGAHSYVVSEALQGYAPISAPSQVKTVTRETTAAALEEVNGHRCHRIESLAQLSDGTAAKLTEWRAEDLSQFPVRVRAESGGRVVTADFSNVRFDLPAPELFVPQAGFTRYASAGALIGELVIRESSLKKGASEPSAGPGQPANWHEPNTPGLSH